MLRFLLSNRLAKNYQSQPVHKGSHRRDFRHRLSLEAMEDRCPPALAVVQLDFDSPSTGSQPTMQTDFGASSPITVVRTDGGTSFTVAQTPHITLPGRSEINLIGFWESSIIDPDLTANGHGGTVFSNAPNSNTTARAHIQLLGALGVEAEFYYGTRNQMTSPSPGFTLYAWTDTIRERRLTQGDAAAQLFRPTASGPDDVFNQFLLGIGQPYGPAEVNGLGYDESGTLKAGPGHFNELVFTTGTNVGSGVQTSNVYQINRPGASQIDDLSLSVYPVVDLLRNSVTAVPAGSKMQLFFQPKTPVGGDANLQDLSKALGADHFNWRQTLVDWPETWTMYKVSNAAYTFNELHDYVNGRVTFQTILDANGTPASIVHANSTTSPLNAQALPRPTFDPNTQMFTPTVFDPGLNVGDLLMAKYPNGGVGLILQTIPFANELSWSVSDIYNYMYDEGGGSAGHWDALNPRFYQRPSGAPSVFSFRMNDRPSAPAGAFNGAQTPYLQFMTELVAVGQNGDGVSWRGIGTNAVWKTNAVNATNQLFTVMDPDLSPPITSGGVFDVVIDNPSAPNLPPSAADDPSNSTPFNTPVAVSVLGNDSDPDGTLDPTSVAVTQNPASGTLSVNATTGAITYTPSTGFSGTDTFKYTVKDNLGAVSNQATVTVTVQPPPNTPPVAADDTATTPFNTAAVVNVLANDSDPDGTLDPTSVAVTQNPTSGTVSVNATTGAITYTPNTGFSGSDTFKYTVRDNLGAVSNEATVTVTVQPPPNTPPVAADDTATTPFNTAAVVNVLANDSDPDGTLDSTTVAVMLVPASGTLAVNPTTGTITYTPNTGFSGSDTFKYTVKDNLGALSNQATVTVTVQPSPNAAPVAANDSAVTLRGTAVAITVLGNDSDPDGSLNPATVAVTAGPASGSVSVNATTGAITYTPNTGFTGTDTFRYTVRDNLGAVSNEATVTVRVRPPLTVQATTVNDGTAQRSNVEQVQVRFDQATNLAALIASGGIAQAVRVYAGSAAVALAPGRYAYDAATFTLTVDLTADGFGGSRTTMLANGRYELRLDTALITAADGGAANPLIDDDGTPDGKRVVAFHRLRGDFDGSRKVDLADRPVLLAGFGYSAGQPGYNLALDLNEDGVVSSADYLVWTRLIGTTV